LLERLSESLGVSAIVSAGKAPSKGRNGKEIDQTHQLPAEPRSRSHNFVTISTTILPDFDRSLKRRRSLGLTRKTTDQPIGRITPCNGLAFAGVSLPS